MHAYENQWVYIKGFWKLSPPAFSCISLCIENSEILYWTALKLHHAFKEYFKDVFQKYSRVL